MVVLSIVISVGMKKLNSADSQIPCRSIACTIARSSSRTWPSSSSFDWRCSKIAGLNMSLGKEFEVAMTVTEGASYWLVTNAGILSEKSRRLANDV